MTDQAAEIAKGLTKAQEDALLQRPVCGGRSGHGGRWTWHGLAGGPTLWMHLPTPPKDTSNG